MTKTIRIIITSLDFGGTERHLLQVLPGIKKLGWHPIIHTVRSDCAMKEAFEKAGIDVVFPKKIPLLPKKLRNFFEGIISWFTLYKIFKQDKNCVAHFFLPQAYVLGMMAACLAGHKGFKIMSRRSLNNYHKNIPFLGQLERKIHPKVDLFLANSKAVKQNLLEEGIPENKIQVIHNGINLVPFDEIEGKKIRQELGLETDVFVMTVTANLIPYKGHLDLLNAFSLIKNQLPKRWIVLCVGRNNGIQNQLEQKAQDMGLAHHIKFLGLRSVIPQILSDSDLGILCSHQEGMPNAVMEYMAARLPVVATTAGGIVDLVENGKTGFLAPIKNPEKLSQALLNVINHKNIKDLGENGRQKIEKEFSIKRCVNKYDKVYKKVLEK